MSAVAAPKTAAQAPDTFPARQLSAYGEAYRAAPSTADSLRYADALSEAARTILQQSPPNVDAVAALFIEMSQSRGWARRVTDDPTLREPCGIPCGGVREPAGVSAEPAGVGRTITEAGRQSVACAKLLTALIAADRPDQVDELVAAIRIRFRVRRELVLRAWYATQLRTWLRTGAAAFAVAQTVLQLHPSAPAMHQSLLLHTAARLGTMSRDSVVLFQTSPERQQEHVIRALWDAADSQARYIWPSEPPPDNPFPLSRSVTAIEISGTYANYGAADWWFSSWGADDVLYTTYAGGAAADSTGRRVEPGAHLGEQATTGRALIRGDDPLHLTVTPLPPVPASASPYSARFPSTSLMRDGVWYVGTYAIETVDNCDDYCLLGPMVGFDWSGDKGRTWHSPPASVTPAQSLFGESPHGPDDIRNGAQVKLSAASFVDFGKNMQHSPDGKAYLIGHGTTEPGSRATWASGDQIYLARVTPSPETINDARAWEFYAGRDARGRPRWSRRFTDIAPLLEWKGRLGRVTVTYDAPLKKYLLFTTHQTAPSLLSPFDMVVLEADRLTGPWRLVSYLKDFGPQAYSVTLPSKFIGADGRTAWLSYTANFFMLAPLDVFGVDPPGGGYWMHVHQIRLLGPADRRSHARRGRAR